MYEAAVGGRRQGRFRGTFVWHSIKFQTHRPNLQYINMQARLG